MGAAGSGVGDSVGGALQRVSVEPMLQPGVRHKIFKKKFSTHTWGQILQGAQLPFRHRNKWPDFENCLAFCVPSSVDHVALGVAVGTAGCPALLEIWPLFRCFCGR